MESLNIMSKLSIGISKVGENNRAVSSMIEYILISGILMLFLVITIPLVSSVFIDQPSNQLTTYAFTDIGNGVSTRIVNLYAVIPYYNPAIISTKFDIPDDVAGRDYWVEIAPGPHPKENFIIISRGDYQSSVSLSGIGATAMFGWSGGKTTASGLNRIEYAYAP